MLTLMGYRQTEEDGTYILEGPVDPDRVADVSRDSLVALVECQVCFMFLIFHKKTTTLLLNFNIF